MIQIDERKYLSTYDFVATNSLEIEAIKCFGKDWEAEDDVNQINALLNHIGRQDLMCEHIEESQSDNDLKVSPRTFNLTIDDLKDLKYKITQKLVEEGIIPDCTDTEDETEVDTENAIEETIKEFVGFDYD